MKTTLSVVGLLLTGVMYQQVDAPGELHDLGDVWGPFEGVVDGAGDIGVAAMRQATETVQVTDEFLMMIAIVLLLRVTWPTIDRMCGHWIAGREAVREEAQAQADHARKIELAKLDDELRRRE